MFKHDWPMPHNVKIAFTDRLNGCSQPPFDSLNLGDHVGDNPEDVQTNRAKLKQQLNLPSEPIWLKQVHGTTVINLSQYRSTEADGSYTQRVGEVCVVMIADCLPVLLCDKSGTQVAAVHAGWRGLCEGVIESGISKFSCPSSELIAYLGPAIGENAFEVGAEVKAAFCQKDHQAEKHFVSSGEKYLADLVGLAKMRLQALGVSKVYSAEQCTFSSPRYFSYRRDGVTGRQAALIWLTDE